MAVQSRENVSGHVPMYRVRLVDMYIERYVEGNMTAKVEVWRGDYDSRVRIYAGRARVHRLFSAIQMGFGDEPQPMVSGTISIPRMPDWSDQYNMPQVDDLVTITDHFDPLAIGRAFRVVHVDAGGQFKMWASMSVVGAEPSPTMQVLYPSTPEA